MSSVSPPRRPPAAGTVITRDRLAHARALAESFARHHPGGRFYLLVVDGLPAGTVAGAGAVLLGLNDLATPHLLDLAGAQHPGELCTLAKPALLRLLTDRYGEEVVVLFDPAVLVARPLTELADLARSAGVVLTPQLLRPTPPPDGTRPADQDALRDGAYNPGLLAVGRGEPARAFLGWWADCFQEKAWGVDVPRSLLTPRKWLDLAPVLFGAAVLREEAYGVGPANLHQRVLTRDGERFLVNGRPLATFHFGGVDGVEPGTALADLLASYAALLARHGHDEASRWTPGPGRFAHGTAGDSLVRQLYWSLDSRPWEARGEAFADWVARPDPADGGLTPFVRFLHRLRTDVTAQFPDPAGNDRDALAEWVSGPGASEMGYDPALAGPLGTVMATAVASVCSVVIPVYNKASLTRQCLDTLLGGSERTPFEVVVVDDCSTDSTREVLAGYGDRVRVVVHETNTGFATACNDGAAAASGEYLVFLNNDTIPQPGWLDALVRHAKRHPRAGAVGSKLLFPDDTVQHAGVVIVERKLPLHLYAGFPADHPAVNKSRRFQAVTGASLLIRRNLFAEFGGFDTAYLNGFEDIDLCLRLGERGYEVHYCHESVLYHLESVTRDVHSEADGRNAEFFHRRWDDRLEADEVQHYVEDGLLTIEHNQLFPVVLSVSTMLAAVDADGQVTQADRILHMRARQFEALLKENIRLSVRLKEAELRAEAAAGRAPGPRSG